MTPAQRNLIYEALDRLLGLASLTKSDDDRASLLVAVRILITVLQHENT